MPDRDHDHRNFVIPFLVLAGALCFMIVLEVASKLESSSGLDRSALISATFKEPNPYEENPCREGTRYRLALNIADDLTHFTARGSVRYINSSEQSIDHHLVFHLPANAEW